MNQRISAGGIVVKNQKVLLVHHKNENAFDFWVMPGGRVEGSEGIFKAAEREVFEETNLIVKSKRIAYIEDFIDEGIYICKFWVYCEFISGNLNLENKEIDEDFLIDTKFFSKEEIKKFNVFPSILKEDFWDDLETDFKNIKYLGFGK